MLSKKSTIYFVICQLWSNVWLCSPAWCDLMWCVDYDFHFPCNQLWIVINSLSVFPKFARCCDQLVDLYFVRSGFRSMIWPCGPKGTICVELLVQNLTMRHRLNVYVRNSDQYFTLPTYTDWKLSLSFFDHCCVTKIEVSSINKSIANGDWFRPHGSWLKAHGSWPKKKVA